MQQQIIQTKEYGKQWSIFKKEFNLWIQEKKQKGKKIAVYGSGARSNCLINFLNIASYIEFYVDDQKEKQGLICPGSRLENKPSSQLEEQHIDICLLGVNAENEEKVINKHKKFIQQGGEFYSILPPANNMVPVWEKILTTISRS